MYNAATTTAVKPQANRQFLKRIAFQGVLPCLLAGLLYYELTRRNDLATLCEDFSKTLQTANLCWLLAALLLMPFNWWTEVRKWQPFVNRLEPMSQRQAWRAVLAGVAVSLCTPNRVGEYGGRVLFVQPENRWAAAMLNLAGNFSQALILITAGAAGAFGLAGRLGWAGPEAVRVAALATTVVLLLCWSAYFNLARISRLVARWTLVNRLKRFVKGMGAVQHCRPSVLAEMTAWAALRYAIYCTQYFLLLRFFGLEMSLLTGFSAISVLFLLQTTLPLPPVTGLLTRGNLAIGLWGQLGANAADSLSATLSLWIINLILPAFFGTFFLLNVKMTKSNHV